MFLMGQHGLHRVPVLGDRDGETKIVNLITQSAILKLLARHLQFFVSLTSKTLTEIGLGTPKHVVAIDEKKTVWEAFKLIRDQVRMSILCLCLCVLRDCTLLDFRMIFH